MVGAPRVIAVPDEPVDFDDLYEANVDWVWRLSRRLGVPEATLDDAVQEVFIIAHRRLDTFRGAGSPRAWLGGIAVRVASDARRAVRRRGPQTPLDDAALTLVSTSAPGPDSVVEQRQRLSRAVQLLEQLPEELRAAFVLSDIEGLTAPEIAEALGVNLHTVYSRIRTARVRFNALAAGQGAFDD